jgi:hypothetical protein
MRLLVLGLAILALSAGVVSAQAPATPVYPRYGYAPHGLGYGYGYHHRYYAYHPRYHHHRYGYRY